MNPHVIHRSNKASQNATNTSGTGENNLGSHAMNPNIMSSSATTDGDIKTSRTAANISSSDALDSSYTKVRTMDVSNTVSTTVGFDGVANGNQNGSNEGSNDPNFRYRTPMAVMISPGGIGPLSSNVASKGGFPKALLAGSVQALPWVRNSPSKPLSRHAAIFRTRLLDNYATKQQDWVISQMKALFRRVPPYYRSVASDGACAVPNSTDRIKDTQATEIATDANIQITGIQSQLNDCSVRQFEFETLEEELMSRFNILFRSLPPEIREMIIGFAITWDGKSSPNLVAAFRFDKKLYHEALSIFARNYTFVYHKNNAAVTDKSRPYFMPYRVWRGIRNLRIEHGYGRWRDGGWTPFWHLGTYFESPYSPCKMCDFQVIQLATEVRSLHLGFGNCRDCRLPFLVDICRAAVKNMAKLERLVLELSLVCSKHSTGGAYVKEIALINFSLGIKAKLLCVNTEFNATSPDDINGENDSFFWQARKGGTLNWID